MHKSNYTKNMGSKYRLFTFLGIICIIAPLLIGVIAGFKIGATNKKVILGMTLIVSLICVAINAFSGFKHEFRFTIWIMLLGIYQAIGYILPIIIEMAVSTGLYEFVFRPLARKYKNLYIINKEMDKRGNMENKT